MLKDVSCQLKVDDEDECKNCDEGFKKTEQNGGWLNVMSLEFDRFMMQLGN